MENKHKETNDIELRAELKECLVELNAFDAYIEGMLKEAKVIDTSFGKVSKTFNDLSDAIVDEIGEVNTEEDKQKVTAAILLWGGAKIVEGVGELTKAYKIATKARKQLEYKKEKAETWLPSLERNLPRTEKLISTTGSIINKCAQEFYPQSILLENKILLGKRKTYLMALGIYRKAIYCYFMTQFIISECNAWINDKHDGEMPLPTLEDVNGFILNETLFPLTYKDIELENQESSDINNEIDAFLSQEGNISGRILFLLSDEQLMAWYLGTRENPLWLSEFKREADEATKHVLDLNPSMQQTDEFLDIKDDIEGRKILRQALPIINGILLTIICYLLLNIVNDKLDALWMYVVCIASSAFIWWRVKVSVKKIGLKYQPKLEKYDLHIKNTLLTIAGKRPTRITITEQIEKVWMSVICAFVGGLLGFLLIPIPGGLLIGALVCVALFKNDSVKTEDSDGSDYNNVKTGNSYASLITLVFSAAFLCYLIWFK